MPADNTANKCRAFLALADRADVAVECPTCNAPMAVDMMHALAAVDRGALTSNRAVRWAEVSHTVPGADGGNEFALECNRCNRARGEATWAPPANVPTYTLRSKDYSANRAARGIVRASRERLASMGYPIA